MASESDIVMDELGRAISERNVSRLMSLYQNDVVIWHAATGQQQSKNENCALLENLFKISAELRYENIRRYPIDGGVVQQHCLTGLFDDGAEIPKLEACMVVKINNGKISSLDEYFDAQTFAPVWERLA